MSEDFGSFHVKNYPPRNSVYKLMFGVKLGDVKLKIISIVSEKRCGSAPLNFIA
jgi:hypothetical protein